MPVTNFHRDAPVGDIHFIHQFVYANGAARMAAVLTTTDIGKVALQTDVGSFWVLHNNVGPIWGQVGETGEFDAGSSGAAKTIDFNNGSAQTVLMTAACTFTLSNPRIGEGFQLRLLQDGVGGHQATWPGNVLWPSGAAPTLSALNKNDLISLYYNGTNFFGNFALNY